MTMKKSRANRRAQSTISARPVHRVPIDTKKLAGALIELAIAKAETAAQAEHEQRHEQTGGAVKRRSA
jgi:hypothetical protein